MKIFKRLILIIIILIITIISIMCFIGYSTYSSALKEKPLLKRIEEITSNEHYVKFDDMSETYRNAVIAVEDHRYYDHGAIDFIAIGRALFTNLKNMKFLEGGSTITQQVAKNVILTQEQTWVRKIAEIFAAYDLEKNYTKNQIF